MTDDKKPREFWIIVEYPYSTWVSSKALNSADANEEIHVIEHSAYEALAKEVERLQEIIDSYELAERGFP
jgi:hypothetical protein